MPPSLKLTRAGIDFSVSLQGNLRSLNIPDLFSLLYNQKKTGLLSLVSREDERGILFWKGDLVYATFRSPSRRLGSFLVSLGSLNEYELGRSAGARDWRVNFLGQELLSRGTITKEQLHSAVRKQILDVLDEVLLWPEGAFHFDDWREPVPYEVPLDRLIGTQNIVLEAIRRYDESQIIRQSFPDLSLVLELKTEEYPPLEANGIEGPIQEILALIDGQRSISQILRDSTRSPYETSVAITTLSKKGLIQPVACQSGILDLPSSCKTWTLPVAPETPARIGWILQQEAADQFALFAQEIAGDPLLTAKALQQFSMNRLTLPRERYAIPEILESLGDFRVRAFLIPEMVRGIFFAERDFFWKESQRQAILCGQISRCLAHEVGYSYPEEAFLAGLLSNLGIFLLVGAHPKRYKSVAEKAKLLRQDLTQLEEQEFGISHNTIGGAFAEEWKFPKPVVETIRNHHQMTEKPVPILDLVALANWAAKRLVQSFDISTREEAQVQGALKRFRLKRKRLEAFLDPPPSESMAISAIS